MFPSCFDSLTCSAEQHTQNGLMLTVSFEIVQIKVTLSTRHHSAIGAMNFSRDKHVQENVIALLKEKK